MRVELARLDELFFHVFSSHSVPPTSPDLPMDIPVTEHLHGDDELESVTIHLEAEHVRWLRSMANHRGVSIDHVVRYVINLCRRMTNLPASGDRPDASPPSSAAGPESSGGDAGSTLDRLRRAQERIRNSASTDDPKRSPESDASSSPGGGGSSSPSGEDTDLESGVARSSPSSFFELAGELDPTDDGPPQG